MYALAVLVLLFVHSHIMSVSWLSVLQLAVPTSGAAASSSVQTHRSCSCLACIAPLEALRRAL